MTFGVRKFFLAPHAVEETPHATVVEPFRQTLARAGSERVVAAGPPLRNAILGELVERIRPVVPVDEVEVRIAGVIGDGAPMLSVFHAMNDRAIAARRFAEAAAVIAAAKRAELAIDERNELARQVIGVVTDRRGVDVLVTAQRGEAIGKHEDCRSHLAVVNQARNALGHVVGERSPAGVREARAREADEIEQHRKAPAGGVFAGGCAGVVLRRQPDGELAPVRIAQQIVLEHLRFVFQNDERAGLAGEALDGHRFPWGERWRHCSAACPAHLKSRDAGASMKIAFPAKAPRAADRTRRIAIEDRHADRQTKCGGVRRNL